MDELVFWARVFNLATGLTGCFWLITKVSKHWGEYGRDVRVSVLALTTYAFGSTYSTAEIMRQGLPGGFRIALVAIANVLLLYGLWHARTPRFKDEVNSP